MLDPVRKYFRLQQGATAIEYSLIASLIAVVIIAALALTGGNLTTFYNMLAAAL